MSIDRTNSQAFIGTDNDTDINRNGAHPSMETLKLMEGAQHMIVDPNDDPETVRVKRAYKLHEKNVQ